MTERSETNLVMTIVCRKKSVDKIVLKKKKKC